MGVNIACSGGVAKNLYRSSNGGEGQNGEPAQGDLLASVAKAKNVRLIIVSIGANDLGFAKIVAACLQAYETRAGPCKPEQQPLIEQKIPAATAAVKKSGCRGEGASGSGLPSPSRSRSRRSDRRGACDGR